MAESSTPNSDDVDTAVREAVAANPEDTAALIEQLGVEEQFINAMTDGGTEPAPTTGATSPTAALSPDDRQQLAQAIGDNADAVANALDGLTQLESTGDLETLLGVVHGLSLLSDAMDDELVMSLGSTASSLGEVADAASKPSARTGTLTLIEALGDAAESDPEPVGMTGLMGALRDEDVKQGIGFFLAIARAMGQRLDATD